MQTVSAALTVPLLRPDWAPPPGVVAAMSLRARGAARGAGWGDGAAPWNGFNLGDAVGDDAQVVAGNRALFAAALGARPRWLHQVHGTRVVRLHAGDADQPAPRADAAWTTETDLACAVLVADCLPVLMALRDGSAVAAAHAGWRGLAAGVLEATVAALCSGTGAGAKEIVAWLGPCIGPHRFEVGADVLQAFGVPAGTTAAVGFASRPRPDGSDGSARWLADLRRLARDRLLGAGVQSVSQSDACTVEDASRFFSFRRDGVTGRHVAAIWRRGVIG